jgi:hypothetical protein
VIASAALTITVIETPAPQEVALFIHPAYA